VFLSITGCFSQKKRWVVPSEESLQIIKVMQKHPEFYQNWLTIRNKYRETLNKGAYRQSIAFTPHDYDRHCVNIYTILDSILLRGYDFERDELNIEHVFILNVAVILHDIYMAYNPDVRDNHSEHARNFVISEQGKYQLPLDSSQAKCVGDVILGHSDLKNVGVKTIDLLPEVGKSLGGVMGKKINVRVLSALLRLADELDENSRRIYMIDPSLYGIVKGEESWLHWRKCELLHFPTVNDEDGRIINLNLNSELLRTSGTYPTDYRLLAKLKNKILGELEQLNDKVFFKKNGLTNWKFTTIEFSGDDDIVELTKKVEEDFGESSEVSDPGSADPLASPGPGTKTLDVYEFAPSDAEFESRLSHYVLNNGYFRSGHFFIDTEGKCCARDWIDTDHLLQDETIRDEIIGKLVTKIGDFRCNIIGVGHNGLSLAAILGAYTSNPFSYIIHPGHRKYNVEADTIVNVLPSLPVVVVTDVVVTGKSVSAAMAELESKYAVNPDNIRSVLTVFLRKPIVKTPGFAISFMDKLFSLNNQLGVEICRKPQCCDCLFRDNMMDLYDNKPKEI
jgi:orotate phosphoribosyltransferase